MASSQSLVDREDTCIASLQCCGCGCYVFLIYPNESVVESVLRDVVEEILSAA